MSNTGNTLVYADQEFAELAVDRARAKTLDLLDDLREANKLLDSLTLHRLIEKYEKYAL